MVPILLLLSFIVAFFSGIRIWRRNRRLRSRSGVGARAGAGSSLDDGGGSSLLNRIPRPQLEVGEEEMEFPSATVQQALNSLASCIRCRERRVGCDRLLPTCQACAAIGADCELYDHVLDAKFPRSYLQQLHLRLQHLEQLQHQLQPHHHQHQHPSHASRQHRLHTVPSLPSLQSSSSLSDVETQSAPDSLAFLNNDNGDRDHDDDDEEDDDDDDETRGEWGPSSSLAHLRLVADLLNIELHRPLYQALSFKVDVPLTQLPHVPQLKQPEPRTPLLPPMETSRFLFEFYYNSIDTFMPILGRQLGDQDLHQLYTNCSQRQNMRACTRAQLALAIAARCLFRSAATQGNPAQSQAYLQLSDSMFDASAASLKTVLSDSTQLLDVVSPSAFENEEAHAMAKLQIVLLMVCYVLCAPKKGNVWQLLGFAERLWRNMQNARAQLRRSNSPDGHLVREQALHRPQPNLLYCSFVSLERMVGMAYGRPIDFLDFAEADEPTHRPEDKSVAALHAAILELKQSVHAAFLSGHQEPGGILGPAPGTPKTGSPEWYYGIKRQAETWFEQWIDAVETMTRDASPSEAAEGERISDSRKHFLLSTGRKWRDEALHLAFCLLMLAQQQAPTPTATPGAGRSPLQRQQALSPELLAEGRNVVRWLVQDYAYLLRQPFTITHGAAQIPLVFPRHWVFDLEVFRTAVTAAYLSHHRDGGTGLGGMTWEVANCVKLLTNTSAEVDAEGLCEAILALVEAER